MRAAVTINGGNQKNILAWSAPVQFVFCSLVCFLALASAHSALLLASVPWNPVPRSPSASSSEPSMNVHSSESFEVLKVRGRAPKSLSGVHRMRVPTATLLSHGFLPTLSCVHLAVILNMSISITSVIISMILGL